ncbi:hypothetical protein GQ55_9G119400 [Panicum hallii var. hallii]|uniref:Uncharacterized protein n=1 Tax=Panicum hallii var. hallii TaxID=1504633 RepID=A0A2T7C264_9POAL|nr:hypothetical protein GQ55_9G119400 [Panicum hallii var. hallii]
MLTRWRYGCFNMLVCYVSMLLVCLCLCAVKYVVIDLPIFSFCFFTARTE